MVSGADTAELSGLDNTAIKGATVCAPVPAEVLAACMTAAACSANPAGLVPQPDQLVVAHPR